MLRKVPSTSRALLAVVMRQAVRRGDKIWRMANLDGAANVVVEAYAVGGGEP